MAGAGYKLFNTGDVLTAAQVNTYLMEQTVMVFADAAARTAALSGVVSEGMISYLKDTNAVEVYNGSAWVASDDPNAIQNTIVDAKGDLITATAADTPARLAVGSDGSTLVADSSASTGLRWQGNFAAGKNKIINGDFNIWQRGTTFTVSASNQFTADRFSGLRDGNGTLTVTRQSFTAGTAPVAGYENQYFAQYALTSAGTTSYYTIWQPVEDVRTFAGQTITVSFWARLSTGSTGNGYVRAEQNFGSGGSGSVNTDAGSFAFTSTWTRYSATLSIPSISGKTVGSSSYLGVNLVIPTGGNAGTLQVWGIQAEAGNVATAFQTATGTLAGEFALAQRYYERFGQTANVILFNTMCYSALETYGSLPYLVQKRTTPTLSISGTANFVIVIGGSTKVPTASGASYISTKAARVQFNTTGLTAGQAAWIETDGGTNAFIEVSAEL